MSKSKLGLIILSTVVTSVVLSACESGYLKDARQTRNNVDNIVTNQPQPDLKYSQRRNSLGIYYKLIGERYMPSCTIFIMPGQIAMMDSVGTAVNLSHQMTSPDQPEPDSVNTGTTDQTIALSTNNKAVVSEADTIDVVNSRCPAYVKGMTLQDAISGALATRQEVRTDYINVTKGK